MTCEHGYIGECPEGCDALGPSVTTKAEAIEAPPECAHCYKCNGDVGEHCDVCCPLFDPF